MRVKASNQGVCAVHHLQRTEEELEDSRGKNADTVMVFKPGRLNCDSHGSQIFLYKPVIKVKRTALMNGFQLI